MELLTATYTRDGQFVRITFLDNGEHEFTALGEVTDEELMTLAHAQGGNVTGWACDLS